MARFTDQQGVIWDVKTTTITVDPGQTSGKFVVTVADESTKDYSAHTSNADFRMATSDAHVVWPANGNPIIDGEGGENAAVTVIRLFAQADAGKDAAKRAVTERAKTQSATTATTTTSEGAMLPLLLLVAVILLADKGR